MPGSQHCGPISMGQLDYLEFTLLLGACLLAARACEKEVGNRSLLFSSGLLLGYAMSIKPLAIILLFAPAGMAFPARTRT